MMKIEKLTIQGFRGINETRTLDIHNSLTFVFGKNSHGKTSISEALEWLLFGSTSKVDMALSKQEYSSSFRNCHYSGSETPFVEVVFVKEDGTQLTCRGELDHRKSITKYLNNNQVNEWPWETSTTLSPKPFIIQHALKSLLLAKPVDRYEGFTRLIGAEELNEFQENIAALCTKYKSRMPERVSNFLNGFSQLEKDIASHSSFSEIYKIYKGSSPDSAKINALAINIGRTHLEDDSVDDNEVLQQLKMIRSGAIKGIFGKRLSLSSFSSSEQQRITDDEQYFINAIGGKFPNEYTELIKLSTIQHIISREAFINLGIPYLNNNPNQCPFCHQALDVSQVDVIHNEHKNLISEIKQQNDLKKQQDRIEETLNDLRVRLEKYYGLHIGKSKALLSLNDETSRIKLSELLDTSVFQSIQTAIDEIERAEKPLSTAYNQSASSINKAKLSVKNSCEEIQLIKQLGVDISEYIAKARKYREILEKHIELIAKADQMLKRELDKQAGTQELGVLINLITHKGELQKKFIIEAILRGLSELRSQVNEFVAEKLADAIEKGLTSDVMKWYNLIKTSSDPDVHFTGFNLPKTQKGTTKARQIGVRASSYGEELASAISSLSESKLNALGLCINIANNLESGSPFGFIIIDDPVQSLDTDHEAQITSIIRKIAEDENKQIILFSHEREWLRKARKACRSMNGYYYEISGYKITGPNIQSKPWATVDERRSEIVSLVNKSNASEADRQHAAEEFRLLFNELAANIWMAKKSKPEGNVAKYSNKKVREILIQCDMDKPYIDQIHAAYTDLENSHHQPAYTVSSNKLQDYLKLTDYMKTYYEKIAVDKKLSKATSKIVARS